jgi:hypothetical protein
VISNYGQALMAPNGNLRAPNVMDNLYLPARKSGDDWRIHPSRPPARPGTVIYDGAVQSGDSFRTFKFRHRLDHAGQVPFAAEVDKDLGRLVATPCAQAAAGGVPNAVLRKLELAIDTGAWRLQVLSEHTSGSQQRKRLDRPSSGLCHAGDSSR